MKADNVLKVHQSIMNYYNLFSDFAFAQFRQNERAGCKALCNNAASFVAKKSTTLDNVNPQDKIMAASGAAYKIAAERLEKLSGEEYLVKFKETYDAALRIELYRQFLSLDLKALKLKFKKEKPNDKLNLESFMNFLLEDIEKNINSQFSKFEKTQSSVTKVEYQIISLMKEQLDELLDELRKSFNATLRDATLDKPAKKADLQNKVLDFQIAAGRLIRSYQVKTKSNESWAPFLLNMLLLITAFGTLPAIYSLGTKAVTGHYTFFDKPTIRQTPVEEMASEDKLLGFNEPIVDEASEKESAPVVVKV